MYIERAAFFCLLCGMFAVCYVSASLYVLVSIILVVLLFLLYDSRANHVIHTRGTSSRTNPLSRLLISFRVWIDSSLLSVMKTYKQFTSSNRRIDTNVSSYSEGENRSYDSRQGYFIDNSELGCEDFELSNRHNTVGTCFSTPRTVDSMHNMNKSSGWRSAHHTARYVHVSKDSSFSPKESPWGKSVSPKLRSHSSGVKTLQTVAGPLLASTRFNMNVDVGLYGNMASPGFSSRIAHYATESSRTVTHQKQYSAPGQFPIVHLDHNSSKLPVITSCKGRKNAHTPVTIRIAPPEILDTRMLSKSQILGSNSTQEQQSSKSVLEVLKEMSRKRIHAQLDENEDDDVIKRQRKSDTQFFSDQTSDSEQVDITPIDRGKRVREDSPSHCESVGQSSHHKSKRTRNNEILSSLSSSKNLLTHIKASTKRKSSISEWSGSSTSIWGKPPKQACGNIERISESPKIATEVKNVISPVTSVCDTAPSLSTEKSTGKSSSVKPSEFLPKFAAVLDKSSGPMLNSVAALEAKRVYDSKTRLRSMLAIIAGEDDFIRKPVSSASEDSTPVAGAFTSTTTNISFPATLPLVATSSDETTMKEKVITPEISNPATTVSLSQSITSLGNLTDTNNHVRISTPITSTTFSNSISSNKDSNNKCLESLTSEANKTSSSAVTSIPVPVDQKKADVICMLPTALNSREEISESMKKQEDPKTLSHVATTSTNNMFSFGSNSFSSPHSELLKNQSENSPQSIFPLKTNLVSSESVTSSHHTTKSSFHTPDSTSSGGFAASSMSTVVSAKPVLLPETTKSLLSFVKSPEPGPLNGPNNLSSHTTSTASLFPSVTSSIITKPSVGLFMSPSVSSSVCSVTSSTKSDVNLSTTEPNKSLQFGIKPVVASSSSSNISNPFQLNAASKSSVNPVGGFKFDFSKGVNVSGSFQNNKLMLTTSNTNSTTSITTTSVATTTITTTNTTTISSATTINTATTSGTNVPSVTNTSASITTLTNQSSSPFQFGSTVSKPVFSFGSNVNVSNGPIQTSGFTEPIFGSVTQEERISQKPEQKPFAFGASSSTQNQNFSGTFSFGSTASNNVKSGGFSFGESTNSSNQLKDGLFGADKKNKTQEIGPIFRANDTVPADQSTKPIFQTSSTKSEAPSGIFGGSGNSSTQASRHYSTQSTAIFGNISGQGQPAGGTFGSGGDSSSVVFGSGTGQTSNVFGNPGSIITGGIFGNSITQPQTSQQNTGLFGSIANQTSRESQPAGSIFGTAPQPSGGIFDSVSSTSGQTSAGVFGASGSTQPVFAFGSASSPVVTSSTGLFGASTSLQTPFQFGAGSSNNTSVPQPSGGFNFGNSGVNPSPSTMFFSSGTPSNNAAIQSGTGTTPIFGQAPAQGMFSIGSGSTAPRARSARPRRQR